MESHLSDWPTVGPAPPKNWSPAASAAFLSDQPRNPQRGQNMNLAQVASRVDEKMVKYSSGFISQCEFEEKLLIQVIKI